MKALIVDQCLLLGTLLSRDLQDLGIGAIAVDTIARAKTEILRSKPDVLITDLFFKDGDFLEFASYRELFPIILLTIHHDSIGSDELKKGVDTCLHKSVNPIPLLVVAEKLVERRRAATLCRPILSGKI
uniref:Response regulator receiver protein n=1 Tax=Cyanothece sp. (strain PCC 7425 / ATCC 29141) TaxID=395961 RepID=B8HY38_CYAP4